MIASVPEGDDKPYKYPGMFAVVDAIVVNKIDLLPYVQFDLNGFRKLVTGLNSDVQILEVSCTTGEGIQDWADWLLGKTTAEMAGKSTQQGIRFWASTPSRRGGCT